jgi:LmbE family N-acetylglucosaminyl deacetylase
MPKASVHWVVFSAEGERAEEAHRGAKLFGGDSVASIDLHSFRDGFFPDAFGEIKERFRVLQQAVDPDLIFTTWRRDAHQDHRLISELTSQTFRDHLILEYEISKYDGDLGSPNVYVPLETAEADRKVEKLISAFESQHEKYWFTGETFRALMRVRGVECRAASGYAEAFYGHKIVFGAHP